MRKEIFVLRRSGAAVPGCLSLLLANCLAAVPVAAAEGFHLFEETAPCLSGGVRLQLAGLPPASPLAAPAGAPTSGPPAASPRPAPASLPLYPTEKHFAVAAAEVVGLNLLPWFFDRYVGDEPWAHISTATVHNAVASGFAWDSNDPFTGEQGGHPYHGSLYFNAARTNGYSFWESSAFAFAGAFLWKMGFETGPPSMNDVVNSTMGGMVLGEEEYRIGNMILDNTASGLTRFLRETAGFLVNPTGGFNRLVRGEMWNDFQNPPGRFPSRLYFELDGQYRHDGEGLPQREETDQGGLAVLLRYGDLFEGDHRHPFEYFDFGLDLLTPQVSFLTQIVARGLLVDWELMSSRSAQQRLGFFLEMDYNDNKKALYAAQEFSAAHLMRVPLGRETDLRTEVGVQAIPLMALGVDYSAEDLESPTYRPWEYGPGFGTQASARIRRRDVDLLAVSWSLLGMRTSSGITKSSRVERFTAEGRIPLTKNLLVGGGWSWSERTTTYDQLPTAELSGTAWRVFAGWAIPGRRSQPERPAELAPVASLSAKIESPWSATAFGGGFFGTRVYSGPDGKVGMASAPTYGLRLGYQFTRVFGLEAGWSRASTKLEPTDPAVAARAGATMSVAINSYELEGLFGFGGASLRGYVGVGAGAQDISPSVSSLDDAGSTIRFAANVALGGLYYVTPHLALRADVRYRWRSADNRVATVICDSEGCTEYDTNLFSSTEATGGVTVRF